MIQRLAFVGEVGSEDVEPAVAIVVGRGGAHTGERVAVVVESCSPHRRFIGEGTIAAVDVKNGRRLVAGYVDVGETVVVEVAGQYAESVIVRRFGDAGGYRNICKSCLLYTSYLFELRADLELPLLLLVDDRSRAHKYYAEMPSAEALRADLETLRRGRRPELALPFAGHYYSLPRRNHLKLATALYWAGYPDQAIPYIEEVLRQSPDNWKALFALGQIHFEAERWNAALENYRSVLRIRPTHFGALFGAGEASARLNDPVDAEKLLRQAVEADPKSADAVAGGDHHVLLGYPAKSLCFRRHRVNACLLYTSKALFMSDPNCLPRPKGRS